MQKPEVPRPIGQEKGVEAEVKAHELWIEGKMKIMRDKLEKVSRKATMGDLFPIVLRWDQDKEANKVIWN